MDCVTAVPVREAIAPKDAVKSTVRSWVLADEPDIRAVLLPTGPVAPVLPVPPTVPVDPVVPPDPVAPAVPVAPVLPLPVAPVDPVLPVVPVLPVGPAAPVEPSVAPVAPVLPAAPVAPVEPVAPTSVTPMYAARLDAAICCRLCEFAWNSKNSVPVSVVTISGPIFGIDGAPMREPSFGGTRAR